MYKSKRHKQLYVRGDRVRLLYPWSGYPAGATAIVVGSYADQYEKELGSPSYTLQFTLERGGASWFTEGEIELISPRDIHSLDELDGVEQIC